MTTEVSVRGLGADGKALAACDLYPHNERLRQRFIDRFWGYVDVRGDDECWEWQGARYPSGYGHVRYSLGFKDNRDGYAHRVSVLLASGHIGFGLSVLHRCDNPPCCNPRHLYIGTQADNVADRDARNRRRAPRGEAHPCAKLTWADVREMRRLAAEDGATVSELARRYGVNTGTVSVMLRHLTWREGA